MSDLKLLQNQALIKKNFNLDAYKKQLSKAQQDLTLVSDPLAIAGAFVKWGASEIPVVGGALNFLVGIFWPTTDVDVWSSIKDKVKELVGDEIDAEEWTVLQNKINEVKDKLNTYGEQLQQGEYDLALNSFNALLTFLDGVEENFKLTGSKFALSFTPLYAMIINLKITFFVESYRGRYDMGLTFNQIAAIKNDLASTVNNATSYLSNLEQSAINYTGISYTNPRVVFCRYYYISVISFVNKLWSSNIDDYINPTDVFQCRIPLCAYGSFPNYFDENGNMVYLSVEDIIACCRDGSNTEMDSEDSKGNIQVPRITQMTGANDIAEIGIAQDKSPISRCTGIRCEVNTIASPGSDPVSVTLDFGKTPTTHFDPDYTVFFTNQAFGYNHINKISVWAEIFVSRVGFYSLEGTQIEIGEINDPDYRDDTTIPQPYNLCTMMGTSDYLPYYMSPSFQSGHSLGGIGFSGIYNNDLAKSMLQTAANTMYSQFLTE
ncbi:hypothetical protein COMNV_01038 [Commensalibacter sp. Nvir]|uniref:insecticidal delta-endotoxin Cry8Ea1 family protein n=1 Tax=Commensalibacter sp. Nvir TaxID=3069817 RepID=UPI002D56B788|nr:hypothetical protein COMNV_01038 [Commensalibacter sp. Nvir]